MSDLLKRKVSTSAASALVALIALCVAVPARALNLHYTLTANYLMFDIDRKVIYCEGQVELLHGNLRFQADSIRVDVKSHIFYAEGNVIASTMKKSTSAAASNDTASPSTNPILTDIEETGDMLDQRVEALVTGMDGASFSGDQLRFDLDRAAGVFTQTQSGVRTFYLVGEELNETAQEPLMGQAVYIYEEPYLTANAVTAARLRVYPGDQYEAWRATMWVKGNKVMSLPFWTNTSKKYTTGKWRIRNISYGSNADWKVGANVRYKEARDFKGFVDFNYNGSNSTTYSADLRQSFRMNSQTSGQFNMRNLFGGERGYTMSMSRYAAGMRSQTLQMDYDLSGAKGFRLGAAGGIKKTRINGYLSGRKTNSDEYGQSSMNALVSFDGNRKYVNGNTRGVGYSVSSHIKMDNYDYADAVTAAYTTLTAVSPSIAISKKTSLDWNTATGLGGDTEGRPTARLSASARIGHRPRQGMLIQARYNFTDSRYTGNSTVKRQLMLYVSKSKGLKWNSAMTATYDIREATISSLSSGLDYTVNKKCRFRTDFIYSLKNNNFSTKNFNVDYDLYGTRINTRWFADTNDFMIDFTSNY